MAAAARDARGRASRVVGYSLSEDDKDEDEEFPEFFGGGLAKFFDFRTDFVIFQKTDHGHWHCH